MAGTDWTKRWQEIEGEHWVAEAERYDSMVGAFGEAMLDAADLRPGERVLDIGCGNGATTIEAARRVRPGGVVVGIDLSSPMLGLARQRASAAGANEIEFVEADAQRHDFAVGAFDVAVSRFGVMFFDDPGAAFANIGRALAPGGRLAFVAWQALERSEWIMVPGAAAAAHVGMPEGIAPNEPGPGAFADPARVRGILDAAGFVDIAVDEVIRPIRMGNDVDDAVSFLQSIPLIHELFEAAEPEKRSAAVDAAREALKPYAGPQGVVMHNTAAWLVTARR